MFLHIPCYEINWLMIDGITEEILQGEIVHVNIKEDLEAVFREYESEVNELKTMD